MPVLFLRKQENKLEEASRNYEAGPLRLVFKKYGLIAKNVAPNMRRLKNQADVARAAGVSGGAEAPKKKVGDIVVGLTVMVQKGHWKGHTAKVIRITMKGKIKVRFSANGASYEYARRSLALATKWEHPGAHPRCINDITSTNNGIVSTTRHSTQRPAATVISWRGRIRNTFHARNIILLALPRQQQ
jgi:hypothetical protein